MSDCLWVGADCRTRTDREARGGERIEFREAHTILKAGFISTADIYVTYTKERPIGAIQRARGAPGTDLAMPRTGLHRGRTQHMSLSAVDVKTICKHCQRGTKRTAPPMECAPIHHRRTVAVD